MINEVAIIRKKRVDERGNLSGEIKYFQKRGRKPFRFSPSLRTENKRKNLSLVLSEKNRILDFQI